MARQRPGGVHLGQHLWRRHASAVLRLGRMRPAPPERISVLVADDQRLSARTGFRVILASEPGIEVVGEAANGVEAVELARARQPDVVLMDIRMPHLDGFEATRKVLAGTRSRVLILTTFDSDEYVYEALRAGASGFLLKDAPADQLITAVRCVAAGDACHRPERHPAADQPLHPVGPPGCADAGDSGEADRAGTGRAQAYRLWPVKYRDRR